MGKTKSKKTKRKKMKLHISEKKYKKLISMRKSKQKMSSKDNKLLNDSLYVKYCKCLKKLEFTNKNKRSYPICMNSVYKNRGFKPPFNASRRCNKTFNKNIDP